MPCQDASACQIVTDNDANDVLVAIVSDGAGSAKRPEVGARLACSSFTTAITACLNDPGTVRDLSREWVEDWLAQFQRDVALCAESQGLTSRDLACTISAAVVGMDAAMFLQVGDGVIVVSPRFEVDEYSWVFWPQRGEYANETIFATEERALKTFEHDLLETTIDEICLLTDGLQQVALHMESKTAFGPFFQPLFATVRTAPVGFSSALSEGLNNWLSSPRVEERTNDDKTIVLATRTGLPHVPLAQLACDESEGQRGDCHL